MVNRGHDERWDELALGHVLGGLGDGDASEFRGHLAGCPQCRARVAELRSMASDLAAAEREERTTQRLRTQIESRREPERERPEPPDPDPEDRLRRRALVAGAVVVAVLLVLALWNAHLRSQNEVLREVANRHAETLTALGAGTVVPVTTASSVTGVVSVDDDRVAWSLAGLPPMDVAERLVVWVQSEGEWRQVAVHTPAQIAAEDGRLASTVRDVPDASQLRVTVEAVGGADAPSGDAPILRADLNVAGS